MRVFICVVLGGLAVAAPARGQSEPFFLALGDLPTGEFESIAFAVSDDGGVVVGSANVQLEANESPTTAAFRWTREEGMMAIEGPLGWHGDSIARGVSGDGRTVVGSVAETPDSLAMPFVWTAETGMTVLPLRQGTVGGAAVAVSHDGGVIVGSCTSTTDAFATRWVAGQALEIGGTNTTAAAVSHDGTVIVGYGGSQAYRWTEESGMVDLGILPGGAFSIATDVTPDGSTVIGYSDSTRSPGCCVFEVFRWTADRGMTSAGFLARPHAISADARTIVGGLHSLDPAGTGFFWENGEVRRLRHLLASYRVGSPIEDYSIDTTYGMTPDGNTFVGVARDAMGQRQAYIASIGPYCLIDWDQSGLIDSQDLFGFLTSFFDGDADFDGDGVTDSRDWFDFYNDWRFQDCF